jgi:hypothetical protein
MVIFNGIVNYSVVTLLHTESTTVSVKKITPFLLKRISQYADPIAHLEVSDKVTLKVVNDVTTTVQTYNLPAASRISEVTVIPSKSVGPPASGTYSQDAPNVEVLLYGITLVVDIGISVRLLGLAVCQ